MEIAKVSFNRYLHILTTCLSFLITSPVWSQNMCPGMEKALGEYFMQYPKEDSITVYLMTINNKRFCRIHSSVEQRILIDGVVKMKDERSVFINFLNLAPSAYSDVIYQFEKPSPAFYSFREEEHDIIFCRDPILYEVISGTELKEITKPGRLKKVKSGNVIKDKRMNRLINRFINRWYFFMYEIGFERKESNRFVTIRSLDYYDDRRIDGYFIRDGRLILLSGLDNIDIDQYFSKDEIIMSKSIPWCKRLRFDEDIYFHEKYRIEDNGKYTDSWPQTPIIKRSELVW